MCRFNITVLFFIDCCLSSKRLTPDKQTEMEINSRQRSQPLFINTCVFMLYLSDHKRNFSVDVGSTESTIKTFSFLFFMGYN